MLESLLGIFVSGLLLAFLKEIMGFYNILGNLKRVGGKKLHKRLLTE